MTQFLIAPSILRVKQLAACLSISRSSIYERINPRSPRYDPQFPQPLKIGRVTGFLASEVAEFILTRAKINGVSEAVVNKENS